jgi:large subunit ribosomal protein L18
VSDKLALMDRRRARLRYQLKQKAHGRVRLSVYRSGKHIYAQIIDDAAGRTLAQASSLEKDMRTELKRAKEVGVTQVVFDRGPYLYHGRVQALADAAREGGLDF